MDVTFLSVLSLLVGLLLRFGIPILVTVLLVWFFRRLDARWQAEADALPMGAVPNCGCWKVHHCTEEQRAKCPAYHNLDLPCWQVHRQMSDRLPERCIGCEVFRRAPVPVTH